MICLQWVWSYSCRRKWYWCSQNTKSFLVHFEIIHFANIVIAPCKVIALNLIFYILNISSLLLFLIAQTTIDLSWNCWKSDTFMGSNTEKNLWTMSKPMQKMKQQLYYCYRKIRSSITIWGAIEKVAILVKLAIW